MRSHSASRLTVVALGSVLLAACGSGGLPGLPPSESSLSITSTAITEPASGQDVNALFESSDAVNWRVPLAGGCEGPYVVDVISGALPPGVAVVDGEDPVTHENLHHLRGTLLDDGVYNFRLQVTDTSCEPFASTFADFRWEIAEGNVTIVGAEPILYAPGTHIRQGTVLNPVYPALQSTVYGQFTSHQIVIAGGVAPYTIELVDDPTNPDDGNLPLGASIPPDSAAIVGAPVEIKADGSAFVFTIRARDSNGQASSLFTLQWEVYAPPIIMGTTELPDGQAGTPYSASITVIDGVPPFNFEFVKCDVNRHPDGEPNVTYQSPQPPIVAPACALQRVSAADYPAAADFGPDYRALHVPPEGILLGDQAGTAQAGGISGVPRRRGDFRVVVHVWSALVPTTTGQHNWGAYEFTIAPSEPPVGLMPAFSQDPAYTVTGAFSATQPYARIAEAEVGANYNPDAASHPALGLQLLARGGVRKDGLTDAPHVSEAMNIDGLSPGLEDGSTAGGGYDWVLNTDPVGDGDAFTAMPPGMAFDDWIGVWRVADSAQLELQGAQALEFTVFDQQLPIQLRNEVSQRVNFSVGPDKLIFTESQTSSTVTTANSGWSSLNDNEQTVRVCFPYTSTAPQLRDLVLGDLADTHVVPSTTGLTGATSLATLLTKVDLMRANVNPSGWWDDVHSLNANAARHNFHADPNAFDYYLWGESDNSSTLDYSMQPSATSVDVPQYRPGAFNAVTHSPSTGLYTDGGKLYPFSNPSYFGVFMIRSDSSIYVPFAVSRTTSVNGRTYTGFGDGVVLAHSQTGRSQQRVVHMAFSPDKRFAAVKIKTAEVTFTESAATTPILIFSLTGEKAFGGQTWTIVESGSSGTTSTGTYLYAPSLVMTNSHLYYLCGNLNGTFTTQSANREHYIYRFQFANPTTGAVVAGATGTGAFCTKADATDTNWTNTTNNRMQTRFQQYTNSLASGNTHASHMREDGMSGIEPQMAPLPFRVSADGRSIAILAMPDQASGVNQQAWHVWVDFQGNGVRRLSTAPRHITGGGTRGYALGRGASTNTYENWHRYGGPTPQLEISDDGSKVAVVANRYAGSPTISSPTSSWPTQREDVIAYRTADNVSWTEIPVTGDGAGTNIFSSAGGAIWRFGTLVFTKDNDGLVFFGGFSSYWAANTSSTYQSSHMQAGTLYGTNLATATGITGLTVTSLLASANGGSSDGITNYTTSSQYNPTLPAGAFSTVAGVIKPFGGFLSKNRDFFYLTNKGSIDSSGTEYRLLGVNVRSTNTGQSINGRTDFRAFAVSGWPARRGFNTGAYGYYSQYGISVTDYHGRQWGRGRQVMSRENGWVFFTSQYQASGPVIGSSTLGGPMNATYSYDYASYGGQVEVFNAETAGQVQRLTSFTGDTLIRRMHFVSPTADGSALGFVFDTFGIGNSSPSNERLYTVHDVDLNAAGNLTATPTSTAVEANPSRVGDAFSFSSGKDKLYYGVGGAGNENAMTLKEATFTSGGSATTRTLSSTARRYNVLHASR